MRKFISQANVIAKDRESDMGQCTNPRDLDESDTRDDAYCMRDGMCNFTWGGTDNSAVYIDS